MKRPLNVLKKLNSGDSFEAKKIVLKRVVLALILFVLATRLISLGNRPFHHDESLDAWFSLRFLDGNFGGYDPVYHGPLRFYITAGFFWLFGESDFTERLLAAISGSLLACVPWFWRKQLGSVGTVSTICLFAASPSMLYFSRFGREDMFFLFATAVFVALFFAFLEKPKGWHPSALLVSVVVGLAIKESVLLSVFLFVTFLFLLIVQENLIAATRKDIYFQSDQDQTYAIRRWTLLTGLGSMLAVFLWVGNSGGRGTIGKLTLYIASISILAAATFTFAVIRNGESPPVTFVKSLKAPTRFQWLITLVTPIVIFVVIFSQFFTSFAGPKTSSAPHGALRNGLTAGFNYWTSQQKEGSRGDSRWQYYLTLLSAYEWLVVILALLGIWGVLRRPNLFGQIMLWWAGGNLILYSWAGERMPWLIIHPLLPLIVLAGLGSQFLWMKARFWKFRNALMVVLSICAIFSATQSLFTSYSRGSEPQELFVQAGQATPEVKAWSEQLYDSDRVHYAETGNHLIVQIDSDVYWPYGWYLRDFPTSTYAIIEDGNAPAPELSPDILFLPYWDTELVNLRMDEYETFSYNHRWWWVPEFDAGISNMVEIPKAISRWGNWMWSREPWIDTGKGSAKCPASLSGKVIIKKSVIEESRKYGVWNNPQDTTLPSYSNACKNLSFSP